MLIHHGRRSRELRFASLEVITALASTAELLATPQSDDEYTPENAMDYLMTNYRRVLEITEVGNEVIWPDDVLHILRKADFDR